MTSPGSGAGSAPELPDYAPTTRDPDPWVTEIMSSATPDRQTAPADRRWLVLVVVAVTRLMVVLDYSQA